MEGVVRAKRKPYVPVVLSREEIATILQYLPPPYDLVVKLLYGCGLRLSECLQLRVQCFNVDAGVFTIHDGKGGKDRTVPLPDTILPELRAQLESLKDLHQRDLERDYAGVFLVNALERKYTHAAKECIWPWLFPGKTAHLSSEDGGIPAVSCACNASAKGDSGGGWESQDCISARQPIRFATVLRATCSRPMMISGRFRSDWDTAMSERR